jgi:hypothetical protein
LEARDDDLGNKARLEEKETKSHVVILLSSLSSQEDLIETIKRAREQGRRSWSDHLKEGFEEESLFRERKEDVWQIVGGVQSGTKVQREEKGERSK